MAKNGSRKKFKNGLTVRQSGFVNEIVKQIKETGDVNGTQAAMKVYDTKNKKIAQSMASENLSKPIIKDKIEAALLGSGFTIEKNISEMIEVATTKPREITGDVKLRALTEILKLRGAYPNSQKQQFTLNLNQNITNLSFDEAKQKLTEMSFEGQNFIEEVGIEQ